MKLSSTQLNKTKAKALIVLASILLVASPLYFANAGGFLEGLFYNMVVGFFGGIAGLCGMVLNYAVGHFVVGFTKEFNSPQMNEAIGIVWTLVRDLFNITFIFGLVYIGFIMILKSDSSNTRKWLINLVIAALLVNFSLLISKIVIDVSNMTATQILNAGLNPNSGIFIKNTSEEVDFAGSMMKQMKITQVFKDQISGGKVTVPDGGVKPEDNSFEYSFALMLVFLIVAFVFLSAGIMLIIRGAVLVLFMVFSPIMFLGFVIPSLMKTTQEYWREFLSRAFFAPIYILIVFVGMSIFDAVNRTTSTGVFSGALSSNGYGSAKDVELTFGPLALFVVLMIASLNIAKKLGAEGAATAIKAGNYARKKAAPRAAGRMTAGSAAFVGRNTVGRGASALANNRSFQKWAAGSIVGRQALKGTRAMADGNYDIRNTGVVKGAAKAMGVDVGKGAKGGFDSRKKKRQKKEEDFMNSLDKADMKDPKNRAKAKQKAGKIKADAEKNIERLRALQKALEDDAKTGTDMLEREIDALSAQIKADKSSIKSDKTLSKEKKDELREKINFNKELAAQKKTLIMRNKKIGKASEEVAGATVAERNQQLKVDSLAGDPARAAEYEAAKVELAKIKDSRAKAEAKFSEVDSLILETRQEELQMGLESLSKFDMTGKTGKELESAQAAAILHSESIARAEVEFENRLRYIQERDYNANSFTFLGKGASIPGFTNMERQDSVDNLKKKFGGNAEEMGAKSKRKATLEEKAAAERKAREDAGVAGDKDEKSKEPDEDKDDDS